MITLKNSMAWAMILVSTQLGFAGDSDLDPTFGDGGLATATVGTTGNGQSKMTLQPDGKILICGSARDNQSLGSYGNDVALVRYNQDGTLDTTFSGDGKLSTDIGSSYPVYTDDRGSKVLMQPDNKIIVAGTTRSYTKSNNTSFEWYMWDVLLLRYEADGSIDTDFGTNGQVVIDINGNGSIPEGLYDLALQSDGKIIGVGYTYPGNNRFLIMRFNTDGSLDTTFGSSGSGIIIEHFSINTLEDAYAVQVLSDDSILVAGRGIKPDGNATVSILKLTSEGLLDTTFNGSGKIATSVGISATAAYITTDASGRILVCGQAGGGGTVGGERRAMIQRYNSDGSLDTTFNETGTLITIFGDFEDESFSSLEIQADGKIIAAGSVRNPYPNPGSLALLRLNTDGSLDETFAPDGKLLLTVNDETSYSSGRTALQPDGKLLWAVSMWSDNYPFGVLRFGGSDIVHLWNSGFIAMTDGWQDLSWFGMYKPVNDDWIWHVDQGYISVIESGSADGLYYYSSDGDWLWTSETVSPWYYNITTGTWGP